MELHLDSRKTRITPGAHIYAHILAPQHLVFVIFQFTPHEKCGRVPHDYYSNGFETRRLGRKHLQQTPKRENEKNVFVL